MTSSRRLGELLVERKVLSREVLEACLQREAADGRPLAALLIGEGLVGEKDLVAAIAAQAGTRFVDLSLHVVPPGIDRVVPAALAVGFVFLEARRIRDLVIAAATSAAVFLAAALPWGIDRVWSQTIAYHRDSERLRSYGGNLRVLGQTLVERDPFVVAAVVLAVGLLVVRRRRGDPGAADRPPSELESRTALVRRARKVDRVVEGLSRIEAVVSQTSPDEFAAALLSSNENLMDWEATISGFMRVLEFHDQVSRHLSLHAPASVSA